MKKIALAIIVFLVCFSSRAQQEVKIAPQGFDRKKPALQKGKLIQFHMYPKQLELPEKR
jgi:hypothetical protein